MNYYITTLKTSKNFKKVLRLSTFKARKLQNEELSGSNKVRSEFQHKYNFKTK
jgi:hypothetical protein